MSGIGIFTVPPHTAGENVLEYLSTAFPTWGNLVTARWGGGRYSDDEIM